MTRDYHSHRYRLSHVPHRPTLQQFFDWLAVNTVDAASPAVFEAVLSKSAPLTRGLAKLMGYLNLTADAKTVFVDMVTAYLGAEKCCKEWGEWQTYRRVEYRRIAKENELSSRCLGPVNEFEKAMRK